MTTLFEGKWIWTSEEVPERNSFVRFRRNFEYSEGKAKFHIIADSRYVLYVNGVYMGQGPVRSWPSHSRYDTYDIEPYLQPGDNAIAVLVNHYGEGNFQYIAGPEGLLAQLELEDETIITDESWKASPDPCFISVVPRISVQEAFEEQFDGRNYDGWPGELYDDSDWKPAVALRPANDGWHKNFQPRGIPFLTLEPVLPQRIVNTEKVRSIHHHFTIYAKPYLIPGDFSSNMVFAHAYLATQVWAPEDVEVSFPISHGPIKVNGKPLEGGKAQLKSGWNSIAVSIRAQYHHSEFMINIDGPAELKFCAKGEQGGSEWALVGPFAFGDQDNQRVEGSFDTTGLIAKPEDESATCDAGEAFWNSADVASVTDKPYFQEIMPEHLPEVDVFAQAYTDKTVDGAVEINQIDGLLSGAEWTTIYPPDDGSDVRILLDFGREVLAYHSFEISAPEGTIIDFHNFEFIQPDGRYNFAEGMHNSSRYICDEGYQYYQTYVRRGFKYSYLILRNLTGPVKLGRVEAIFTTYPQSRRGNFASSDAQLDRIWEVGAHTLRCCSEDTYTDCPTYEQTHWVGDARNEALIDWAINGDPRLWYRCLEQAGDSLERSVITESHVPSAWQNILTAWSLLWMRSCKEYVLFTGDFEKGMKLLDYVERNVQGLAKHINDQGLLSIRAWNMFDWAPMDTPTRGVVTHNNCQMVHALNDVAEMAEWLDRPDLAEKWRDMASSVTIAVNEHLWNAEKQAYTDCLHGENHSTVFSQQTQTAAYISGVATGERAERCRDIMYNPPEGFVVSGSPFFQFFLLEALQREGREQEFIDIIRRDWGFMVDMGATTFWEMWSAARLGFASGERMTRSHCHGWSAAPTFFLSAYVLGITPGSPGFEPAIIKPHPGNLEWCRGTMPTPKGNIEVQWENNPDKPFVLRVNAPKDMDIRIELPRKGAATINGERYTSE